MLAVEDLKNQATAPLNTNYVTSILSRSGLVLEPEIIWEIFLGSRSMTPAISTSLLPLPTISTFIPLASNVR